MLSGDCCAPELRCSAARVFAAGCESELDGQECEIGQRPAGRLRQVPRRRRSQFAAARLVRRWALHALDLAAKLRNVIAWGELNS